MPTKSLILAIYNQRKPWIFTRISLLLLLKLLINIITVLIIFTILQLLLLLLYNGIIPNYRTMKIVLRILRLYGPKSYPWVILNNIILLWSRSRILVWIIISIYFLSTTHIICITIFSFINTTKLILLKIFYILYKLTMHTFSLNARSSLILNSFLPILHTLFLYTRPPIFPNLTIIIFLHLLLLHIDNIHIRLPSYKIFIKLKGLTQVLLVLYWTKKKIINLLQIFTQRKLNLKNFFIIPNLKLLLLSP